MALAAGRTAAMRPVRSVQTPERVQEESHDAPVATDSVWQSRVAARISAALDSLSCTDMAVAALASAQGDPGAAIWAAIDGGHDSIRPALELSEAEVRTVAASWHTVSGCSFSGAAAAVPWVSCYQASRNLRPGYTSVLLQVREPHTRLRTCFEHILSLYLRRDTFVRTSVWIQRYTERCTLCLAITVR